jgi:hypothetical protein
MAPDATKIAPTVKVVAARKSGVSWLAAAPIRRPGCRVERALQFEVGQQDGREQQRE